MHKQNKEVGISHVSLIAETHQNKPDQQKEPT